MPSKSRHYGSSGRSMVADHTRDDSMITIARRILATAPPRFALTGLSMGGYIAFEIMRQASARVVKLALLDTGARGDTPEQTERRKVVIALPKSGRYASNRRSSAVRILAPASRRPGVRRWFWSGRVMRRRSWRARLPPAFPDRASS
jgi:pimeloyl-ACP methyl ester carboxylesterase